MRCRVNDGAGRYRVAKLIDYSVFSHEVACGEATGMLPMT